MSKIIGWYNYTYGDPPVCRDLHQPSTGMVFGTVSAIRDLNAGSDQDTGSFPREGISQEFKLSNGKRQRLFLNTRNVGCLIHANVMPITILKTMPQRQQTQKLISKL